eukprot:TRINITY_DN8386_c0_g3_i1.p1 TRINITY_DN8386_c0_g3~~TRINITY_DN8386_c0_g3_i1.p1  ORF type:complete len:1646 (-),score=306.37 TRINITY_DN8386_c0_g3_i1:43-4980(-)
MPVIVAFGFVVSWMFAPLQFVQCVRFETEVEDQDKIKSAEAKEGYDYGGAENNIMERADADEGRDASDYHFQDKEPARGTRRSFVQTGGRANGSGAVPSSIQVEEMDAAQGSGYYLTDHHPAVLSSIAIRKEKHKEALSGDGSRSASFLATVNPPHTKGALRNWRKNKFATAVIGKNHRRKAFTDPIHIADTDTVSNDRTGEVEAIMNDNSEEYANFLQECKPKESHTWASYCALSKQRSEKKLVEDVVLVVNMEWCTITMGMGQMMALSQCYDNSGDESKEKCMVFSRNGLYCKSQPIEQPARLEKILAPSPAKIVPLPPEEGQLKPIVAPQATVSQTPLPDIPAGISTAKANPSEPIVPPAPTQIVPEMASVPPPVTRTSEGVERGLATLPQGGPAAKETVVQPSPSPPNPPPTSPFATPLSTNLRPLGNDKMLPSSSTPFNEKATVPQTPQFPLPGSNQSIEQPPPPQATVPQPPQVEGSTNTSLLPPRSPSPASVKPVEARVQQSTNDTNLTENQLLFANLSIADSWIANSEMANSSITNSSISKFLIVNSSIPTENQLFFTNSSISDFWIANSEMANSSIANSSIANFSIANSSIANTPSSTFGVGTDNASTKGIVVADILKRHNLYRCLHNVSKLTWNPAIAENAERWALTTGEIIEHSPTSSRRDIGGFDYIGENSVWGRDMVGPPGVDTWYNEILTTENKDGNVNERNETLLNNVGHFSQLVWRETTEVGCGMNGMLLVCQYGPGGNMLGQYKFNVLPKTTKSLEQCEAEVNLTVPSHATKMEHKTRKGGKLAAVSRTPKRRRRRKTTKFDTKEFAKLLAREAAVKWPATRLKVGQRQATTEQRLENRMSPLPNATEANPLVLVKQHVPIAAKSEFEQRRVADSIAQTDVATEKPHDLAKPVAMLVQDNANFPVSTQEDVAWRPPEAALESAKRPASQVARLVHGPAYSAASLVKFPSLSQKQTEMRTSQMIEFAKALVPTVVAFDTLNHSEVHRGRLFASNLRYSLEACAGVFGAVHANRGSAIEQNFALLLESAVEAAVVENISSGHWKERFSVVSDRSVPSHSLLEIDAGSSTVDSNSQPNLGTTESLLDLGMSVSKDFADSWHRFPSDWVPPKETTLTGRLFNFPADTSIAQAASPSSLLALSATEERDAPLPVSALALASEKATNLPETFLTKDATLRSASTLPASAVEQLAGLATLEEEDEEALAATSVHHQAGSLLETAVARKTTVACENASEKPLEDSRSADEWSSSEVPTRLAAEVQKSTQELNKEAESASSEASVEKMVTHAQDLAKQAMQLASMMYAAAGSKTAQKELQEAGISADSTAAKNHDGDEPSVENKAAPVDQLPQPSSFGGLSRAMEATAEQKQNQDAQAEDVNAAAKHAQNANPEEGSDGKRHSTPGSFGGLARAMESTAEQKQVHDAQAEDTNASAKHVPNAHAEEDSDGNQHSTPGSFGGLARATDSNVTHEPAREDQVEDSSGAEERPQDARAEEGSSGKGHPQQTNARVEDSRVEDATIEQEVAEGVRIAYRIANEKRALKARPKDLIVQRQIGQVAAAQEPRNKSKTQRGRAEETHVDQSPVPQALEEKHSQAKAEQHVRQTGLVPREHESQDDALLKIWMDCVQKMVKTHMS